MARLKNSTLPSRKEQILDQAAALFKARGFNATTMRHLAGHLQLEAASLYNHISSKEELLRHICFWVADQFNEHLAQLEAEPFAPAQKIETLLRFHIHMHLTHHSEVYVSNRDWKHLKEPYLSQFLQIRRQYENRMAQIIQQGIRQGQFRSVHPHVAVLAMLSTVRSVEYWHHTKRAIGSRQLSDDLITLLLQGIQQ